MAKIGETFTLWPLNWLCFFIGMAGLWFVTHSWAALGFGFIAALHFQARRVG